MALCIALAIYGPDRTEVSVLTLLGIGIMQVIESKIPLLRTTSGATISFLISLALWYILLGFTDGIESSYYWIMVLPVIAVATSQGLLGTTLAALAPCAAYVSFVVFLRPDQYIPEGAWRLVLLRAAIFPVVGYLAHELAEASRVAARKHQIAAEELAKANQQLREAEAAVRRTERLAALGQLSAGLAHEIRNPLSTIKTSAEMLRKSVDGDTAVAQEMAGYISSEVDRTNALVTRFLDFARPLVLHREQTELASIIDQAIAEVEKHTGASEVTIYKNYSPDIPPLGLDAQLMERVLYNLLLNAVQASPAKGSVTVKTRPLGDTVEIAVIDRGSGIDPKDLETIFNPFFTTKSSGTGLGLAIVSKIVDEHGGTIDVESESGSGSVFRIFLPMREDGR